MKKTIDSGRQMLPLVEIESLSKYFPGNAQPVIDQLNLTIYQSEIFALLGPSGCGKTTLMRLLAGFELPSHGAIRIAGEAMEQVPPYARPVNMMFQSYALFPHMTVWENIAFGLQQEKLPQSEIKERVENVLAMVKMTQLKDRRPKQLSGGQQQRVALARSLVKRPKLLLLDEPLGALDKNTREHTQMELLHIQASLGVTFVMVTHDQEEAMMMAHRIAIMKEGHILQIGTPREIYSAPKSRFVADFIGSISFIEVSEGTNHSETHWHIRANHLSCDLIAPRSLYYSTMDKREKGWVLGIRPEACMVSEEPLGGKNCLKGILVDRCFVGHAVILHVRLANGSVVTVRQSVPSEGTQISEAVGDGPVWVCWSYDHGYVLPQEG